MDQKEYRKNYYIKNKNKLKEKMKEYYIKNRLVIIQNNKNYYNKNKRCKKIDSIKQQTNIIYPINNTIEFF